MSHDAHENRREPPIWSKNMRPIVFVNLETKHEFIYLTQINCFCRITFYNSWYNKCVHAWKTVWTFLGQKITTHEVFSPLLSFPLLHALFAHTAPNWQHTTQLIVIDVSDVLGKNNSQLTFKVNDIYRYEIFVHT